MKYLFYIHSYITYYVSLGVMQHEQLAPNECVFLYGRGFRPSTSPPVVKQLDMPFTHHPVNSFPVQRQFWRGWRKLKEFDRFIYSLVQEDLFQLYTNQTGIDFIRLFISHKQCAGFSYLEEGMASYYSMEQINDKIHIAGSSTLFFKILLWLNFKERLPFQKRFYTSSYDCVYGLSDAAFPDFKRKVSIPFPFCNNYLMPCYGHILVLDALAEYGVTSDDNMIDALTESFKYFLANDIRKIWIKFHPEQMKFKVVKHKYEQVIKKFAKHIAIEVVPTYICLELVAGNTYNSKTVFYVFQSSVGLYAGLCGREVYSFAAYVSRQDRRYEKLVQLLPEAFKENVKFL